MLAVKEGSFKQAEFVRNVWAVNTEVEVKFEDILKSEYWAHVAKRLRKWDMIEIYPDDESFFAVLLVKEAGANWAKVCVASYVQLEKVLNDAIVVNDSFSVKLRGPRKWSVIRQKDNGVMKDLLSSKEDAYKWIGEHEKALAA